MSTTVDHDARALCLAQAQLSREFISETMCLIRVYAEGGEGAAFLADDVALEHNVRQIVKCTRAALTTFNELDAIKRGGSQ